YSPFHKIINENGFIDFPKDIKYDTGIFENLLQRNIKKNIRIKINKAIYKNPLTLPVLCEYQEEEHWSSKKVWYEIKKKLGPDIWKYVNGIKFNKRKNGYGILLVQKILKELHKDFDVFLQQIRVTYLPLYIKNVGIYAILKMKNMGSIVKFSKALSENCLSLVVCPPLNKNSKIVILYIITNAEKAIKILYDIIPKYVDKKFKNRIIWKDVKKSRCAQIGNFSRASMHLKIDYKNLFDIENMKWKFETKKYIEKLKKLKP
ncbi:MAG: hypothetical protein J7K26_00580, partial [Candidatus Aenigmarchaeota archaeon]|nr:hypothetical protein [Candidatus Aenigmarchaeota archaeon]